MNSFKIDFAMNVTLYNMPYMEWCFVGFEKTHEFTDIKVFLNMLTSMRKTFYFKINYIQIL